MAAHSPVVRSIAARVAVLERHHGALDPRLPVLRRDLRAERLADYITKVVATAPPLTAAQLDRLGALLRPSAGGGPHHAA